MIRFQRIGRKNDASFRMAVLEKTAGPKAGKYVDLVGTYNPKTKQITYKAEKIQEWVKKGAQVSPSLKNLLIKNGVLEGKVEQVISTKNLEKNVAKRKAEEEAVAAKVAEEKAQAEAKAQEAEAPSEEAAPAEETPTEDAPSEETPAEEEKPAA